MALWTKDETVRINDTVTYIAAQCPVAERPAIQTYLNNWIGANFNTPALRSAFSQQLSTDGVAGRGDATARAGRRALVILRGGMLNAANPLYLAPAGVMAMPAGAIAAALAAVILPFRIFALQEQGNNTQLQAALTSLTTQPDIFLQNNVVVCQSWGAPPGGMLAHKFLFDYRNQTFLMLPPAMPQPNSIVGAGINVNAVNVPEIYWANVPGRGNNAAGPPAGGTFAAIVATPLTGATLMVTSAFTGCSFCFKNNGGLVFAAHIGPATPNDPSIGPPPTLATQLVANGNFAAPAGAVAGALQVFGRGLSNIVGLAPGYTVQPVPGMPLVSASMYVFGVVIGGAWRIYSQENQGANKTVRRLL
jgi:hypothetical protein